VTETISSVPEQIDTQQLAQQLVERARVEGVDLVGPGGLLTGLTKSKLLDLGDYIGCHRGVSRAAISSGSVTRSG
jgi:hypothetical protein